MLTDMQMLYCDLPCARLQVTLKGSRSEVKVYTDLAVGVRGVSGAFGIGLQPTLGLVRDCLSETIRQAILQHRLLRVRYMCGLATVHSVGCEVRSDTLSMSSKALHHCTGCSSGEAHGAQRS